MGTVKLISISILVREIIQPAGHGFAFTCRLFFSNKEFMQSLLLCCLSERDLKTEGMVL